MLKMQTEIKGGETNMLKRNFTMLMLCMTLCVIICNMLYVNSYAETGREYIYNNETNKETIDKNNTNFFILLYYLLFY